VLRWPKTERILESTRGRVVEILRRGPRTADELAAQLKLTDNAIRAHLATLERDGLVQPLAERRGGKVGKPATVYTISAAADPLFSKAYLPLLTSLLAVLGERLSPEEMTRLLSDAGARLATGAGAITGDLSQRVRAASRLLNDLGGVSSVEELEAGRRYLIESCGCPLGVAVSERPEVCQVIVTLLSQVTGAEARSCCKRSGRPACCFEIEAPGPQPAGPAEL
jgi:predicted ArsR family transcriptional regulator